MNIKQISLVGALAASSLLAGCATDYGYRDTYNYGSGYNYGYRPDSSYHEHYGTVYQVRYVADNGITGAVAGSVIGGLVGSQIGDGRGQTAATVGGVIAGGVIGREIDRRNSNMRQAVDVRLDGGDIVTIVQDGGNFAVGQRVKIIGTGSSARIVY